ncbi:MAG TPA: hypothetical protein VGK73_03715 [Polyangiaceae bacterium]
MLRIDSQRAPRGCIGLGSALAALLAASPLTAAPPPIMGEPPPKKPSYDDEWLESLVREEAQRAKSRKPPEARAAAEPEAPPVESKKPREPPFGAHGQFVLASDSYAYLGSSVWDSSEASSFGYGLGPALDYFVARNFSLGVTLRGSRLVGEGYTPDGSRVRSQLTSVHGAFRVGVNVPFGRLVSFYPKLQLGLEWIHSEQEIVAGDSFAANALGTTESDYAGPWLSVFAPILFHPRPHLFLGLGPAFFHGFASAEGAPEYGGQRTAIGADFVVGIWWGGERKPAYSADEDEHGVEPSAESGFGRQGQFVISSASDLSVDSLSYAGASTGSTTYNLSPGIDYFAQNRVSVGLALGVGGGESRALEPVTFDPVTESWQELGLAFRVGIDVPIASWLSWYPRGSVSIHFESGEVESRARDLEYEELSAALSLDAPLLFHVASHAFLGFGPYVTRDVQRSVDFEGGRVVDNPGTRFGGRLVIGGWI